jgi:hypothetical protein
VDGEADLVGAEVGGSYDRQHGDDDRKQAPHRSDNCCESEPRHRPSKYGQRHLALQEPRVIAGHSGTLAQARITAHSVLRAPTFATWVLRGVEVHEGSGVRAFVDDSAAIGEVGGEREPREADSLHPRKLSASGTPRGTASPLFRARARPSTERGISGLGPGVEMGS